MADAEPISEEIAYQVQWLPTPATPRAQARWQLNPQSYTSPEEAEQVAARMATASGARAARVLQVRTTTTVVRRYP